MITIDTYQQLPNGVIQSGIMPNSPEGIFMTRDGGFLNYVIFKEDYGWGCYVKWMEAFPDLQDIADHGDRVTNETCLKKVFDCDDQVMKLCNL